MRLSSASGAAGKNVLPTVTRPQRCWTATSTDAGLCVTAMAMGGRCLTGVDSRSKGAPEFVAIDEQPYDEIVHALCLGEAQRTTHEPFDPGPQVDVLALDFLG